MNRSQSLHPEERVLMAAVSAAIFTNPFSDERRKLDRDVGGAPESATPLEAIDQAIEQVTTIVQRMENEHRADCRLYTGDDQKLVSDLLVFNAYHRHLNDFDQLITDQIAAGDEPCAVPFAQDEIQWLIQHGFSNKEALRAFAMFYQLRRAYYFIEHGLSGTSICMKHFKMRLWQNVFTHDIHLYVDTLHDRMEDFSTLLLGETGTGKGAAARAIGRSGFIPFNERTNCFEESFTRSFIEINLSQYPESLIESELFGHKKGAFTGALNNYEGIFSRCLPHGSIFIDEIGDVSIPIQIKLLQVLQYRRFSPVGSHDALRFAGRVIAATNKPLDELRRDGTFRDDFYYRLCSDVIDVPTLRQRIEEDPNELNLLLHGIITRMVGQDTQDLVTAAYTSIQKHVGLDYTWPGNVRELEQAVRRIILTETYDGDVTRPDHSDSNSLPEKIMGGNMTADELLSAYCTHLYQQHGSYGDVAKITELDWRTVKKYIHLD